MPINKNQERLLARQLRLDNRMSVKAISKALNVSTGSVSVWLRDIPLTAEEKHSRYVANGQKTKERPKLSEIEPSSKFHNWVETDSLTNNQKGKIAESATILRLSILQFDIYKSVFDGEKIDIVAQNPNNQEFLKLQVRWARKQRHGAKTIALTCSNGRNKFRRYTENEFDFIIGYDFETDSCYVYSKDEVLHLKTQVSLQDKCVESWDKLFKAQFKV